MSSKELKNNENSKMNKFFNKLYISFPNLETIKKLDDLLNYNQISKFKPINYVYLANDKDIWFTRTSNKNQDIFLFGKVKENIPQQALLILTFDKENAKLVESNSFLKDNNLFINFNKDYPDFKTKLNDNNEIYVNLGNYDENIDNLLNNIITLLNELENYYLNFNSEKQCEICGKKIKNKKDQLCKKCLKKRHAANLLIDLLKHVNPQTPFTKTDLKKIYKEDMKVNDCIWSLQDFNLIEKENKEYSLKNESILNEFIEKYAIPIKKEELKEKKEKIEKLNKTCLICNKTLPRSKFYKNKNSEDGLEDYCKKCKNNVNAANYLKDLLTQVIAGSEFKITDLNNTYKNPIELTGRLWELIDYNLVVYDSANDIYTLVDETKCNEFLEKYYHPKNEKNEQLTTEKQMDIVIESIKQGKTEKEAADTANINVYCIGSWYSEGKNKTNPIYIDFYNRFNNAKREFKLNSIHNFYIIESFANKNELSLTDSMIKQQMETVLIELCSGNSIENAASKANIALETLKQWYNKGKENSSGEYKEFYYKINIIQTPIDEPKFEEENTNEEAKISSNLICAYFTSEKIIKVIINGKINHNQLFSTLNKLKQYENKIIRIITNYYEDYTEIFIELNLIKEDWNEFEELIKKLGWNIIN